LLVLSSWQHSNFPQNATARGLFLSHLIFLIKSLSTIRSLYRKYRVHDLPIVPDLTGWIIFFCECTEENLPWVALQTPQTAGLHGRKGTGLVKACKDTQNEWGKLTDAVPSRQNQK